MNSSVQRTFLTLLICCCTFQFGMAQSNIGLLEKADQLRETGNFSEAIPYYRTILLSDNNFKAKEGLADCYKSVENYKKAQYWYTILLEKEPNNANYQFEYISILQSVGKCQEAKQWLLENPSMDARVSELINNCADLSKYYQHQNNYELLQLPFNSKDVEFGPFYYQKGLIFTAMSGNGYTDLFYSERMEGDVYTKPIKMKPPINSKYNDGPLSIGKTNEEVWITRTQKEISDKEGEGKRNLEILYQAKNPENEEELIWVSFAHNNIEYSVAHPSISADGQKLYFSSDMPGGYGGMDLYECTKQGDTWGQAFNLGAAINTSGNEVFPFIHADNTLYFSSNGHAGLGKLDVFLTNKRGRRWVKPSNIGAPINSVSDDVTFITNAAKTEGYFASNRYGTIGSDDVFFFRLKDAVANAQPQSATSTELATAKEPKDIFNIPTKPTSFQLLSKKIKVNKIIFENKQARLSSSAHKELEKIIAYLENNPKEILTIESYTDVRGGAKANYKLTTSRAKNIKAFLVSNGIPAKRINTIGLGENYLLNNCTDVDKCNELEHSLNDRIVFKVNDPAAYGDEPEEDEFISFDKKETIEEAKPEKIKIKKVKEPKPDKVKEPKPEKIKIKKEKQATPKEKNSSIASVPAPPLIAPVVKTTKDTLGTYYALYTGPYTEIPKELQEGVKALKISPKIELKKGKEVLILGSFKAIEDVAAVQQYLKLKGIPKTKIAMFQNGELVKMNVKL